MPSITEVRQEIAALRECLTFVPRHNFFGEDNHRKIERQIEVLVDGNTLDDVYATIDDDEGPSSGDEAALEAARWLDGANEEAPSSGWAHLRTVEAS
jgi:t-SNARE complex subunit (syntaxin)